jgi:hypothetical protein
MQKRLQIFLAIFIIIIAVMSGMIYWSKDKAMPVIQNQDPSQSQSDQLQSDPIADWKTYRNQKYGFEVKCPPEWTVEEIVHKYGSKTPDPVAGPSGIAHEIVEIKIWNHKTDIEQVLREKTSFILC